MKSVGILLVGSLVVGGFAYYTLFAGPSLSDVASERTRDAASDAVIDVSTPDPTKREAFAGSGSLTNLFARGESLECQITYIPSPLEPEITGSFFIADNQIRGDFLVPTPDLSGQMLSSLIYRNDTIYVWSEIDGEQYGFKLTDASFADQVDSGVSPIPANVGVQYDCLTWPNIDRTIFEPPSTVLFTDLTGVTGSLETGTIYEDPEVGEF